MSGHWTPPSPCPNCGRVMDRALECQKGRGPKPGDITICFYCQHLMAYGDNLTLRDLNDAEIIEAAGHQSVLRTMWLISAFKAEK